MARVVVVVVVVVVWGLPWPSCGKTFLVPHGTTGRLTTFPADCRAECGASMGLLLLRLSTYISEYGSSTAQSATVKGQTFGMVQSVVPTFAVLCNRCQPAVVAAHGQVHGLVHVTVRMFYSFR